MSRLLIAIAIVLVVLAIAFPMPNPAVAMGVPAATLNAADGINMVEPMQFAPEQRQRTEYGELRASRVPACHWERNYKTGISAWVCRTKPGYDPYPRHPRVVPRYRR